MFYGASVYLEIQAYLYSKVINMAVWAHHVMSCYTMITFLSWFRLKFTFLYLCICDGCVLGFHFVNLTDEYIAMALHLLGAEAADVIAASRTLAAVSHAENTTNCDLCWTRTISYSCFIAQAKWHGTLCHGQLAAYTFIMPLVTAHVSNAFILFRLF